VTELHRQRYYSVFDGRTRDKEIDGLSCNRNFRYRVNKCMKLHHKKCTPYEYVLNMLVRRARQICWLKLWHIWLLL